MTYFKKIFYAGPFKLYIGLNIFFNVFYTLFSAVSFIFMIPCSMCFLGKHQK